MNYDPKDKLNIFRLYFQLNLNGVIRFYRESKRLVNKELTYINIILQGDIPKQDRKILLSGKNEYLGWFREMLIINCFLLIYSHLEEALSRTLREFGNSKTVYKSSGIDRFKKPFIEEFNLRICDFPKWNFIVNCSKIRNVILHANGNLSLTRDTDEVRKACSDLGTNVEIRRAKIVLHEGLLQEFYDAVEDMIEFALQGITKVKR